MRRCALVLPALLLALAAVPPGAEARSDRGKTVRSVAGQTPVKDCTRYNGRFGYYANQWCSPAEQARWDRWEARRLTGR